MSSSTTNSSSSLRWWIGLFQSSIFTLSYFISPAYILTCIVLLVCQYPSFKMAVIISIPMLLSLLIPPIPANAQLYKWLLPMLDYYQFDSIIETKPIDIHRENTTNNTNYIFCVQPHGVLSIVGLCWAIHSQHSVEDPKLCNVIPTAVASILLKTPILKHTLGIYNLIDASKRSLMKQLTILPDKKPATHSNLVLYPGGMAELFLSCEEEEVLYLKKRKGFIKLALQTGVDIVPVYMFGNTTVLSVIKKGYLANLSRKLQISLTYFWGKWLLPIPRDLPILTVTGQPIGIPNVKNDNPSNEEIDKYHDIYCQQVQRLFNTYKERVPAYKHKTLIIK